QDIDYDAIERLEYLNACLNETLRLFAPALALEREASEDITLTGDGGPDDYIKVFKGDMVQILVSQLHKDPEQFNDPEKFEPDRFLPQNISHHPYSYLPFGAGPRNCVAKRLALMEAKLAILYSVYNYRYYRRDNSQQWKDRNIKPGNPNSLYQLVWKKRFPEELYRYGDKKYGKLYGFNGLGTTTIVCARTDFISQVLSKEFATFNQRRSMGSSGGDPIMDNMLHVVMGDQWKRLRAIVSPTFSTGKLRKMRPLIDDCLQTLVTNIGKMSANSDHSVDMKTIYGAYTMEVIIQVAFGTKVDALIDDKNPIILNAKELMANFSVSKLPRIMLIMLLPKLAKLLGLQLFPRHILAFFADFVHKIIAERRSRKASDGDKRYDFLQLLLDANERNNEENNVKQFNAKSFKLCVIYRPPGPDSEFCSFFEEFLQKYSNEELIITGDINIDLQKSDTKYEKIYSDKGFTQLVTEPTRTTVTTNTIIDHILTNNTQNISGCGVLDLT
ncbi:unnamed protein product, partial [Medioppia subpectinata]